MELLQRHPCRGSEARWCRDQAVGFLETKARAPGHIVGAVNRGRLSLAGLVLRPDSSGSTCWSGRSRSLKHPLYPGMLMLQHYQ